MRIYITGNDGITLCREAPITVNEGEIAVASNASWGAYELTRQRAEETVAAQQRRPQPAPPNPARGSRAFSFNDIEGAHYGAHPLGHAKLDTTARYTQVATNLIRIDSIKDRGRIR